MNASPPLPGQISSDTPIPVRTLYELLRAELGEVKPWPASSELEYVCGAVLVQNTAWGNVQRSLEALRQATAFETDRLLALDEAGLIDLIRPSGFMKAKARALRAYATWSCAAEGATASALDDEALRSALLGLPGFGPETADVVALMAYDRPRFIFDAYARRLLRQAGYAVGRGYEAARRAHEPAVARSGLNVSQLKDFHGLIIAAGQRARAAGGWETYGPTIGVGVAAGLAAR
ncbi:base excision DNA repair protein [Actinomyces sp. ZJ308]|uniref:endonuclease III domain-containing protein n=1 Tax=Actinomyces sp. ZJ308 TaxID=2708342 RepID=UPI0014219D36|nr:base excision DNA repair protein [Actinomyces sp. ZJ308]